MHYNPHSITRSDGSAPNPERVSSQPPVQRRNSLARAIALVLLAGAVAVPAGTWAATIEGHKFVDSNHSTVKDNGEGLGGETIYLKPTIAFATARPFGRVTGSDVAAGTDGLYAFNGLAKGSYKVWEATAQPSGLQTPHSGEANSRIVTIINDTDVVSVDFRISPPRPIKTLAIKNETSEIEVDVPVNFEVAVTDTMDTAPFQVTWDFGDGQTVGPMDAAGSPLLVTTTHAYSSIGDFTITATVSYPDGTTEVHTTAVKIKAKSPIPVTHVEKVLTVNDGNSKIKAGGLASLKVSANETDTEAFQVTWDFGDGQVYGPIDATGSPLTVTADHYFYSAGDFTVNATVTYQDSTTKTYSTVVKVENNSSPVVKITSPVSSGEPVEIKAGDSYPLEATLTDPDAGDTHRLYYGIWDGSNNVWEEIAVTAPYTLNVPFTVSDNTNGSLQAYVYAYDQNWAWAYDSITLSSLGIKITSPTGDALQNLEYGQPVEFKATLTDLKDVNKHNVYWYFGDNGWNSYKQLSVDGNPSEITASYTYAGGDFTAWVYAYDENWSRWTSDRVTIHVNGAVNSNPTAEFISATITGETATEIDLSSATSVKLERGQTLNVKVKIDDVDTWNQHQVWVYFGDGGWEQITIPEGSSLPYTAEISHAYSGGNFVLWLYVQDDKGGWIQNSLSVEVSGEINANPSIEVTPPAFVRAGVPVKFDVNISDPDTFQTSLNAYWSFGDGTWTEWTEWTGNELSNPSTEPVYHTYSSAGNYDVYVSVQDQHGGWAQKQLTVTSLDNLLPQEATQEQLDAARTQADSVCKTSNANDYVVNDSVIWTEENLNSLAGKVIKIESDVVAMLSITSDPIKVDAVCNHGMLIMNTNSEIVASKLIANYSDGVIQGVDGLSSTTLREASSLSFDEATDGSLVRLTSYLPDEVNVCQGLVFNEGTIRSGRGGDGYVKGGNGGLLDIYACTIAQNGFVTAGNGGNANAQQPQLEGLSNYLDYRSKEIFGGNGANLNLQGEQFFATSQSATSSGRGGDAKSWVRCEGGCSNPGNGGDIFVLFTNGIQVNGTLSSARSLYFEPDILLSGKGTHLIAEEDIVIFGGDGWKLQLNDLRDDAIKAGRDIILATGKDGVIDLRGNTSRVLKAGGKLKIYSDNILLDDGVQLASLVEAGAIEVNPAKILYHATFTGASEQRVKPSTTTPLNVALANVGPTTDTYTLRLQRVKKDIDPKVLKDMKPTLMPASKFKILEDVTNAQGWTVTGLPATITVEGLKRADLALTVTSPATLDEQETFVIAATSQADPSVQATIEVDVKVVEQTQQALVDTDGDNVADEFDAFPNDPTEWTDTDGDKVGNNADTDDDNDKMPDVWEKQYPGLYSTNHDADRDQDQDGYSNVQEYDAATNPIDSTSRPGTLPPVVEGKYTTHGTLKDNAGNPLANVTIQVGDKTVTTDAAGNWKVEGLTEGDYTVKGALDNFTCLSDVALGNEMYQQEVVCKQISSLKVSAKSTPFNAMYQGGTLSYLITATNGSDKTATGVVINNLNLPQGVEVLSLKALDGGECDVASVSCALLDLAPGTSARVQLELGNVAAGQFHHNIALNATGFPTDQIATWKPVKPYLSTSIACTPNPVVMLSELHCTATAELSSFAPEPTATGVKLQFTPSKGTELKAATTTHGQCEIQDGKAICAINDLSIVDATQISKAAVELDLKLVDSGLLVLTSEAKLTAENYAEHSAKGRTNIMIPKDFKAGLVLAIDTTYSMNKFINGVIKGLEQFLENSLKDPTTAPLTVLIEFKDDVRIVTPPTRDLNAVLTALRSLKVGGGGKCPEASVEAFNLGADYLADNGTLSIVTNAPPYPDANVEALKQRVTDMTGKGAKVFILYEPECEVTSETNQDLNGVGTDSLPTTP